MATIIIRLEIEGDDDEAMSAVESALDEGVLQDFVNDYPDAELSVTSATAAWAPDQEG